MLLCSHSYMENHFKMRISRMFRSSFHSCRPQNGSDVIQKPVLSPIYRRGFQEVEPLPVPSSHPKVRPFPSMSRPQRTSQTMHGDGSSVKSVPKDSLSRKRVSEMSSSASKWEGLDSKSCPPPSPTSPLNFFSHCKQLGSIEEAKNQTSLSTARINGKKKKKVRKRTKSMDYFPISSSPMYSRFWWYSSDDGVDENEIDTLFSSKSRSSSSFDSPGKKQRSRRGRRGTKSFEMGVLPLPRKLKDSFAVVKKSSDPYNDFRTSMVEMIIERQIFSPSDLQNLLQCFLSLNSHHHHKTIVEVIMEVSEAMFSDCSLK